VNATIAIQKGTNWSQPISETVLSGAERSMAPARGVVRVSSQELRRRWADFSDEELMVACREDEGAALEELYRRYRHRVYAFVFRNFGRKEQIEDIVQEVFFRVYRNRKQYEPNGKFSIWLYKIARNLCIDETRRYWNKIVSREADMVSTSKRSEFVESVPNAEKGVRDLMDDDRKGAILERAMRELTDQQREIIILNKFQGLTYREIGEITGLSGDAIKQHAYRAFMRLREILDPCREELTGSFETV